MKSLLFVAHGSRLKTSNDEIRVLTSRIALKSRNLFNLVHCAFLEFAEPSISEAIKQCIQKGSREIFVMPYFLSAGRHVVEDIPREVDVMREKNPDVFIHIFPYLGAIDAIDNLLVDYLISEKQISEQTSY